MLFFKKNKPRMAVIVGTRPNFIKVAPFLHQSKKHNRFTYTVVHTGQHFDSNMSEIFFKELGITTSFPGETILHSIKSLLDRAEKHPVINSSYGKIA